MSNTAPLYFTKFTNGEKHILTQIGWEHANEPEVLKIRPIDAYQVKDFVHEEYAKIMNIPYRQVVDAYFPNI